MKKVYFCLQIYFIFSCNLKKMLYICTRIEEIVKGDLVAQLVEHNTFNVGVLGSSPSQVTKLSVGLNFFCITPTWRNW